MGLHQRKIRIINMKTMTKTKTFDCVRMKNDIQAKIHAETKDMSTEELLAYFNRQPENDLANERCCALQGDAANQHQPPTTSH